MKVLITGGNGQLGQCINFVNNDYPELELYFTNSKELDITDKELVYSFFRNKSFDYVINCAAYTNVEQAEKEPKKAFLVNAEGAKNLAEVCKEYKVILIHISTDYVFDGKKHTPYTEDDVPNPINEYGKSKLLGEQYIREAMDEYFIIRTSWLYSQFGHNFYKTILKKLKIEKELTIVSSEMGTPTNANDLAEFIIAIVKSGSSQYGVYHYSNQGQATWYDFGKDIVRLSGKENMIRFKKIDNYPTFAERPKYSVLDKTKITDVFEIRPMEWRSSLKKMNFLF
ncbi:dTDP-4-dehydrorhamnose reductase [uncultured Aquimarina sp.]|uniref:dTDP-4-dehydrorhamnose reductase n=1 Tax=uncultured Aquimarina sp. TaxID=575652 RepID=UPI002627EA69|nr:dTDP-4-dehydrorhamnose reductase [uncultured Aquimarina sp.]